MAAYAVKIPLFWLSDPMLWFMQVEAQFVLKGITAQFVLKVIAAQLTKFHYILANLSQEIATEVRYLLMNPLEENPYDVLKETRINSWASRRSEAYSTALQNAAATQ